MLPRLRQRLLIAFAVALGGVSWLLVIAPLLPGDGSTGLSLLDARAGLITAVVLLLVAGLPVFILGLIASALSHPLAGVFAVTAALMVLAAAGGKIDGFLQRTELPAGYGWLVLETAIWLVGLALLLFLIHRLRPALRERLGLLPTPDDADLGTRLGLPKSEALLAGLICAGVGGGLGYILIRSTDGGQVIGSLLLAFTIGGLVAQLVMRQANPVPILVSPLAVAIAVYGYIFLMPTYATTDNVLEAWFSQSLPGLALALPIHYVSAAVAGCTLGVGVAQGFGRGQTTVAQA